MTKEETVKTIIEKAIFNGYESLFDHEEMSFFDVIFSHDFAKAFWGGDEFQNFVCVKCHGITISKHCKKSCTCRDFPAESQIEWMHHLQQMVLEEDPVKYLENFI